MIYILVAAFVILSTWAFISEGSGGVSALIRETRRVFIWLIPFISFPRKTKINKFDRVIHRILDGYKTQYDLGNGKSVENFKEISNFKIK